MYDSTAKFRCSLLIVDDESATLSLLRELLKDEFDVVTADSAETAKRVLGERSVDIVLTD